MQGFSPATHEANKAITYQDGGVSDRSKQQVEKFGRRTRQVHKVSSRIPFPFSKCARQCARAELHLIRRPARSPRNTRALCNSAHCTRSKNLENFWAVFREIPSTSSCARGASPVWSSGVAGSYLPTRSRISLSDRRPRKALRERRCVVPSPQGRSRCPFCHLPLFARVLGAVKAKFL